MNFKQFLNYCPHCGSSAFKVRTDKSKCCDNCGFTFYINASAAVAAIITNRKGELLVCVRAKEPAKGTFDLPGGFVDNHETAEIAVIRELHEELGAQVTAVQYLFSVPNVYLYSGLSIPTLDMFFKCSLSSYNNLKAADDVDSFKFLPMSEIRPTDFGLASIRQAIQIFTDDFKKQI